MNANDIARIIRARVEGAVGHLAEDFAACRDVRLSLEARCAATLGLMKELCAAWKVDEADVIAEVDRLVRGDVQ
jgi:adenylosuccinate lyase